jgi:hypothetical protein
MALSPDGLDLGGQFSLDGTGGILILGLSAVLFVVVFVFGFFIIKGIMSYKIPVNVWQKTGSGAIFDQDKAKIIRNRETMRPQALQLRKSKIIEEYPGSDYFHPNSKGKPTLNAVLMDNKLTFFRVDEILPDVQKFVTKWRQSDLHSVLAAHKDNADRYTPKKFWDQYGATIMSGMLMVVILIFGIIMFQKMDGLAETFSQGLGSAATRLEEAAAAVNR